MNISEIKTAIEKGASFNGTIYGKDNGKNWTTLFIYLDGKYTKIAEVAKKDSASKKDEYQKILTLDFGTIYNLHGLDVAVGEAE